RPSLARRTCVRRVRQDQGTEGIAMNLRTTLALLALVGAGAALLYLGPQLPTWLGGSPPPATAGGTTLAELEKLSPAELTRVEVRKGNQVTVLEKKGDAWTLPGNWPTRKPEVQALIDTVGHLRSRFAPIPITEETDLAKYGLDQPRMTVKLDLKEKTLTLRLGEPPAPAGDQEGDADPFERPTYLKLDDGKEVVKLAPGLIAQLD